MWCRKIAKSVTISRGTICDVFGQQQRFMRRRVTKPAIMVAHGSTEEENKPISEINKPRARLTKLLDNAGTFDDYHLRTELLKKPRKQGTTLPVEDPFLSSPYTKETKIFYTGDSAADEANRRHIVDPSTTSVMLFPGQGTHYIGMCGNSPNLQLFSTASEILGYDLLSLCQNGPIERLSETIYSQPAIFVSSLSAMMNLERADPMAIETCVATAGFSIGEYAALVYAGVISFEDGVRLVKVRSEAMQIACDEVKSQMATVLYGADSKLGFAMNVAKEWAFREHNIENPVCSVASYLFPHAKVIGGNLECIDFLKKNYADFKLRKVKTLAVSGAFHTQFMKPAVEAVRTILKTIDIQEPRISVYSNVTGYRYHSEVEVRRLLPQQILKPVMWEQMMHSLFQRGKDEPYPTTYEVGPGKSLLSILKYVNLKAQLRSKSIEP